VQYQERFQRDGEVVKAHDLGLAIILWSYCVSPLPGKVPGRTNAVLDPIDEQNGGLQIEATLKQTYAKHKL